MTTLRSALRELMPLLPADARRYLIGYSVTNAALALLDTVAVGLIALTMTPLMTNSPLHLPVIGSIPEDKYVWVLCIAALLMITKSLLSILVQWRATRRFAEFELAIGDQLFSAYITAPWTERLKRSSGELARMADVGIANVIAGVLLPAASLPAEILTFATVLGVLVLAQPVTALITIIYLGAIAAVLYLWIARKALVAGRVNRDSANRMVSLITEMVAALKEITLRDKSREVADVVQDTRVEVARSRANIRLLQSVPKFVIDMALIGGFLLIGGLAWAQGGQTTALTAISIFGIAGFKMVPSITRIQNYSTIIQSNLPFVAPVIEDIKDAQRYAEQRVTVGNAPLPGAPRELSLHGVGYTYPGAAHPAVRDITLSVPLGSSLALVGSSGAGKSTLVDLVLGLLEPSEGVIRIDDADLSDVLAGWRSRVGYVPQDVTLFDGTVAQNVALTWSGEVDEQRVISALERAQLLEVVMARPGGIHGRVGERGLTLSGGQRQRLGIELVAQAISQMHGEVTVIAVAHRLSTVRNSDQVCFLEGGTIGAVGTFEEVVAAAPEFAHQARLAGLA